MSVPARSYEVEIVGVMKDAKFNDPWQDRWPVAFLPLAQGDGPESYAGSLEVRTAGDPSRLAGAVREVVRGVYKNLPVTSIRTLGDQVDGALRTERLIARLSGVFGILALLLAAIGLHGVLAYAVSRRTHEIGILVALGARPGSVTGMVLREAMPLVGAGVAIGGAAATAAGRIVSAQLYGLDGADPLTVGGAIVFLCVVAVLAAAVPARAASRVDPMTALRRE